MNTCKLSIEIPYETLGLFLSSLPQRMRKMLFSAMAQKFDMEVTDLTTGKPQRRLSNNMKISIATPKESITNDPNPSNIPSEAMQETAS